MYISRQREIQDFVNTILATIQVFFSIYLI